MRGIVLILTHTLANLWICVSIMCIRESERGAGARAEIRDAHSTFVMTVP
jgi:hypothetical protein